MKSIAEAYGKDAANIMRDLSMYKVLKKEQVLGLYPGREKVIEKVLQYLTKQRRIWTIDYYYCASPEAIDSIDTSLISAVWVLPDLVMLAALLILAGRLLPVRGKPLPEWASAAAMFGIASMLSPTAFGLAIWSEKIIPIIGAGMAAVIPAAAMTKKR